MRIVKNPNQVTRIQSGSQGSIYSYYSDSLYRLEDNIWKALRYSSLGNSSNARKIIPVDINEKKTIVVTNHGFFDFETEQKININPSVSDFLKKAKSLNVDLLAKKFISLSTNNGLLITDLEGNPVQYLNKQKGLSDNLVLKTTLDSTGLLWVATNFGITKVELVSPFSVFDKRAGIEGNVSYVEEYKENIYLATATGTLRQKWAQLQNPLQDYTFEKMNSHESRYLIKTDDELISLANDIPLILQNGTFQNITGSFKSYYWTGFKFRNSEDLLIGSRNGKLLHLRKNLGEWKVTKELDVSFPDIVFMAQGEGQNIWITHRNGVIKLEYDLKISSVISTKTYGQADGLPYPTDNYVFDIGSKPCFSTFGGIYRYDAAADRFEQDERFIESLGNQPVLRITEDVEGNVYCLGDGYLILKKTPFGYKLNRIINEKLYNYNPFNIIALDSTNIFLPTFGAFVHVDPSIPLEMESFETKITSIEALDQSDTTYYAGFGKLTDLLELNEQDNSLRIAFTAAFYQNNDRTVFKWRIKELDETWSSWSSETKKDYTNIPHGTYTFEVVAKNIHFIESDPATIRFTVFPPWYLTWWAYGLYTILAAGFVWGIVLLNTRRLLIKNIQLEEKIEERTEEISQQRNKLLEMDDLKKRFFVNISHELRTPLTLSMGTIDQALRGTYGALNDELYANLKVSKSNSERLLKMVNNILDISKLEGGKIQLYTSPADPARIVQKVLAFFSSRLADKQISLNEELVEGVEVYLDQDKLETILINLVSNAFKFTPKGGQISVLMKDESDGLVLIVRDSGDGIPTSDLNLVFDRFYQSSSTKSGEGIGVGLALTKELVELHHGSIHAQNDHGAVFTLKFQKGKDHLSPNQIVEEPHETTHSLADKYVLRDDPKKEEGIEIIDEVHGSHILLVEDNPEMRQFVGKILSVNYKVSMVEDGQKGLEFLKNEKPDLIVTDYLMPNMDGYEMAMEIKKSEDLAFIPLIFLTARAREQDKINVLNLGVDDYLFKPFNPEELMVRIKNLLARKNQRSSFVLQESIDPRDIEWKEFPSKMKLQVDEFIESNLKDDITSDQLAEFTNQSDRTLYRKIKVNTGLSVMGYVREYRLRKARTLLENQELKTVSEVGYAVGFNYLSHFTKNYKERFGKNPSEYLD